MHTPSRTPHDRRANIMRSSNCEPQTKESSTASCQSRTRVTPEDPDLAAERQTASLAALALTLALVLAALLLVNVLRDQTPRTESPSGLDMTVQSP
jgi:hypothetical protein